MSVQGSFETNPLRQVSDHTISVHQRYPWQIISQSNLDFASPFPSHKVAQYAKSFLLCPSIPPIFFASSGNSFTRFSLALRRMPNSNYCCRWEIGTRWTIYQSWKKIPKQLTSSLDTPGNPTMRWFIGIHSWQQRLQVSRRMGRATKGGNTTNPRGNISRIRTICVINYVDYQIYHLQNSFSLFVCPFVLLSTSTLR